MMKILHAMETSMPNLAGYTIRSKYIIDNQIGQGVKPVVITSPLHRGINLPFKDYEEIDNTKYYRTGQFNRLSTSDSLPRRLLKRYAYSKSYRDAIQWVAEKESVNIIHSHSSYLNGVRGNEAARKIGIPCVYEVRGLWHDTATVTADIDVKHWKYKFIDYMDRKAMLGADAVVTISRQLRDELITKGVNKDNIHVVPNGVDTQIFKPQTKNKELLNQYGLDQKTVFGFIGSISRIEGLPLFLRHLPEIINKHKSVRVMLVGDGNEVSNLRRITSEYGLDDYVIFTGRINHDQILDYYSMIDIFVYPRIDARVNHKVTPLKPLEAMAMEKVVIASDVGGLKELIDHEKTGLLFKVDDGRSLVEKCLFALENDSFRSSIGKQARQYTVQERDWTKIIKLYNEVYSKLLL